MLAAKIERDQALRPSPGPPSDRWSAPSDRRSAPADRDQPRL